MIVIEALEPGRGAQSSSVFSNVSDVNPGPLPERDLLRIYERIMDVMRQIQQEEIAPNPVAEGGSDTELDNDVND